MHEFSITQNILSIALKEAEKASATKISKINLTIGELSGIVDECVEFYFNLLSQDTMAAGARLCFYRTPTKLRCRQCATTFSPANPDWVCPNCRERRIEIVSGRECHVESIEVD